MTSSPLYDEDIYAWSEQQAAVLRRLATTGSRLPNELDLEHVAEEIEDVGKSERNAAESHLRLILVHLIKLASSPDAPAARHWRSEIVSFHIELLSKLTPSMANRIDLDHVWHLAKRQARSAPDEIVRQDVAASILSLANCPLDFASLASDEFDIDAALGRMPSRP